MSKRLDRTHGAWPAPLAAAALVTLALAAIPVMAALFGVDDEQAAALIEELSQRYDVLTLSDGYALRPTGEADFELIEVRFMSVLVDGEDTSEEALRERLGEDGERIFDLAGDAVFDSEAGLERAREAVARQREIARRLDETIREGLDRMRSPRRPTVRSDARVAFGNDLVVEENESCREAVALGGSVDVRGEVRGEAVAIGGEVDVSGEVDGDVTALGGEVRIGPEARVGGQVVSVGGRVRVHPDARVHGEIVDLSAIPFWRLDDLPELDFGFHRGWLRFPWGGMVDLGVRSVLLAVVVGFIFWAARRPVGAIADRIADEPWKAGLIGLLVQILFLPILAVISLILLISIIGIPLLAILLPLVALVAVLVLFFGYAGVALAVGRAFDRQFGAQLVSPLLSILLGVALIQIWSILGEGLRFVPWPVRMIAFLLIVCGALIKYLAWTVGMGGALLHRFSPLPATTAGPPAPVTPPGPPSP